MVRVKSVQPPIATRNRGHCSMLGAKANSADGRFRLRLRRQPDLNKHCTALISREQAMSTHTFLLCYELQLQLGTIEASNNQQIIVLSIASPLQSASLK